MGKSVRRVAMGAARSVAAAAKEAGLRGDVLARCVVDGVVCEVRVGPRVKDHSGVREACRQDVKAVIAAADKPLPRAKVLRALREAGKQHGESTVAKALADLTRSKDLLNPRDKRGYRLPGWTMGRRDQPRLPGL